MMRTNSLIQRTVERVEPQGAILGVWIITLDCGHTLTRVGPRTPRRKHFPCEECRKRGALALLTSGAL
jgi:hypothetical protein